MEEKKKHSETNTPDAEEHNRYKSKRTHTSKEDKDDQDEEDTASASRIKPFINMYEPFG